MYEVLLVSTNSSWARSRMLNRLFTAAKDHNKGFLAPIQSIEGLIQELKFDLQKEGGAPEDLGL